MLKTRLDVSLVEKGLVETRSKAQSVILMGKVYVNNQKEEKSGRQVTEDDTIEYRDDSLKYVSRGGYKLEKVIEEWKIDCKNKLCIDIGASTGGFTDCLLQNGASEVYAIDVGHNQLAWKLRQDARVKVYEKLNARYIEVSEFPKFDVAVMDVSFISILKILPKIYELLTDDGICITLIKPQFEAGKAQVGNGIITDETIHKEVIEKVKAGIKEIGFTEQGLIESPIKGQKGNKEFLIYLTKEKNL